MTSDDRFTSGLILDVLDVLERHGYHRYDSQHTGQAVLVIGHLAHIYEGARDASHGSYAPSVPYTGPEPSSPEEDDAVILTGAEVSTVVTALDVAADHKRDRAAACTECADQTCGTCQYWLRDAQAYDQMAAQMLQTAEAARTANAAQPEPGGSPPRPHQPQPAADKEAGQ